MFAEFAVCSLKSPLNVLAGIHQKLYRCHWIGINDRYEKNPLAFGGFLSERDTLIVELWYCPIVCLWKNRQVVGDMRLINGHVTVHDDVIKWKHFPRYWPFLRGIHRSPVNSPHKGQRRGALMFSLICARINGWVNNGEAGDLRRHRAHYDVIVMNIHQSSKPRWQWCNSISCFDDYHHNWLIKSYDHRDLSM